LRRAHAVVGALAVAVAASAAAQDPQRLKQDALDFVTLRSNILPGVGARAFGMGGAFIARPDDGTAASWNPAGLSYLRLPEFSIVGAASSIDIVSSVNLTPSASGGAPRTMITKNDRFSGQTPDFISATHPVALVGASGAVQLSFQRVISFDGRHEITEFRPADPSTLRAFQQFGGFDVIAFGSGLQIARDVRVGFTVNRWFNGYNYKFERTGGNEPSNQTVDFTFKGWNTNLGVIWSPFESLNLGAVYKSGFTATVDLRRSRVDTPASFPATQNRFEVPNPGDPTRVPPTPAIPPVNLDFPATFGGGASWRPRTPLTISADYTRTRWSRARIRNYFTLPQVGTPTFPEINPVPEAPELEEDLFYELNYPTLLKSRSPQVDSHQVRLGVEYIVVRQRVKWPLRAGFFLDRQLFQTLDETTGLRSQVPTYKGFTAGTGLIIGPVLLDVAYIHQWGNYRDGDLDSDLLEDNSVRSNRFLVSLIYRLKR